MPAIADAYVDTAPAAMNQSASRTRDDDRKDEAQEKERDSESGPPCGSRTQSEERALDCRVSERPGSAVAQTRSRRRRAGLSMRPTVGQNLRAHERQRIRRLVPRDTDASTQSADTAAAVLRRVLQHVVLRVGFSRR